MLYRSLAGDISLISIHCEEKEEYQPNHGKDDDAGERAAIARIQGKMC
jgi:hypothetical protein